IIASIRFDYIGAGDPAPENRITRGQVYRDPEALRSERRRLPARRACVRQAPSARPRVVLSSMPYPRPEPNWGGGPVTSVRHPRTTRSKRAMRITPFIRTAALPLASCTAALAGTAHAKTLRWAYQGDTTSMDPMALNETFTLGFQGNIYETLAGYDGDIKLTPLLAESCGT